MNRRGYILCRKKSGLIGHIDSLIVEAKKTLIKTHIMEHGPINCVRVSSAQAKGIARKYSYWGIANYKCMIGKTGEIKLQCTARASSDRRSLRLCFDDAIKTGKPIIESVGGYRLAESDVDIIFNHLFNKNNN